MIDINNTDRIIGDFLEINASIVEEESKLKKYNFIKRFIYDSKRKKLIRIINKFNKSNYIINKKNLTEYFTYIYNNFPPLGEYGIIKKISISMNKNNDTVEYMEAIAIIENTVCMFQMYYDDNNIRIILKDKESNNSFDIDKPNLSDTGINSEDLKVINNYIKQEITNYIVLIISKYRRKHHAD